MSRFVEWIASSRRDAVVTWCMRYNHLPHSEVHVIKSGEEEEETQESTSSKTSTRRRFVRVCRCHPVTLSGFAPSEREIGRIGVRGGSHRSPVPEKRVPAASEADRDVMPSFSHPVSTLGGLPAVKRLPRPYSRATLQARPIPDEVTPALAYTLMHTYTAAHMHTHTYTHIHAPPCAHAHGAPLPPFPLSPIELPALRSRPSRKSIRHRPGQQSTSNGSDLHPPRRAFGGPAAAASSDTPTPIDPQSTPLRGKDRGRLVVGGRRQGCAIAGTRSRHISRVLSFSRNVRPADDVLTFPPCAPIEPRRSSSRSCHRGVHQRGSPARFARHDGIERRYRPARDLGSLPLAATPAPGRPILPVAVTCSSRRAG